MKNSTRWMGLSLAALLVATGCKTPQLAWWKSSKSAEATTLAEAPVSPAEAAKQAEQIAPSSSQLVGNEAPAYQPAPGANANPTLAQTMPTAPSSYPKTSAPAYTPENVAAAVSPTPPADPGTESVDGPIYDVGQPPQAPIAITEPAPAPRYAPPSPSATPPANPNPSPSTLADTGATPSGVTAGGNRYGAPTSPTPNLADSSDQAPGSSSLPTYPGAGVAESTPPARTSAPETIVSNEPYRPGGTSSYPGTVPMVAANPPADSASRYAPAPTADEATPAATPQSSSRYW